MYSSDRRGKNILNPINKKRVEAESIIEKNRIEAESIIEKNRIEAESIFEQQKIESKEHRDNTINEAQRLLDKAKIESENIIKDAVNEVESILYGVKIDSKKTKLNTILKINHVKQSSEIEIQRIKKSLESVIQNTKQLEETEQKYLKETLSIESNRLRRIPSIQSQNLKDIAQIISKDLKSSASIKSNMSDENAIQHYENLKKTAELEYDILKENALIDDKKLKQSAKFTSDKLISHEKIFSENIQYITSIESEKSLLYAKTFSSKIVKDANEWKHQNTISDFQKRLKKQHVQILALVAIVSVFGTGMGFFYFSSTVDSSIMEDTLSTKYVIQNLRGDTIDTWHAWKKAEGVPLTIHLMNSEYVTDDRVEIIKNVIASDEKIEIDDAILHKGPQGTTSDYYVGWTGALNSISTDTKFHIPKNLHFQIDDYSTGDIVIHLTDTSNPERYSGFTKSVIDEENHQILKSEITIYNIDKISSDQLEILVRHELGHALGLAHSTDPDDLMAPVITTGYPYISECDADAIEHLYGGEESSHVVCEK